MVKVLIPVFGMMSSNIFFVLAALMGYHYIGIESSSIYVIYSVTIALLNVLLILCYLAFEKKKVNYRDILILAIPFVYINFYFVGIMINGQVTNAETRWFIFFLLWSTPAIYSALYICKEKKEEMLVKWIELLMIIFTLGVLNSIVVPFLLGIRSTEFGGTTYQTASYIAAVAYGLALYFYMYGNNHNRLSFTKNIFYRPLLIAMIITNLIGALLPGGRGAFVLLVIYTLYFVFSSFKKLEIKSIFKTIFIVIFMFFLFSILLENSVFLTGYNRATAFISTEVGINWQGTSNRDQVYLNTINLIREKPLLGYGIFGYWQVMPNPHNLFLELMLSGGIIYTVVFVSILILILYKLFRMIRLDVKNRIWLVLFLYPLVMLMFSGSYLVSSEFWFIMALVISFNNQKKNKVVQKS